MDVLLGCGSRGTPRLGRLGARRVGCRLGFILCRCVMPHNDWLSYVFHFRLTLLQPPSYLGLRFVAGIIDRMVVSYNLYHNYRQGVAASRRPSPTKLKSEHRHHHEQAGDLQPGARARMRMFSPSLSSAPAHRRWRMPR